MLQTIVVTSALLPLLLSWPLRPILHLRPAEFRENPSQTMFLLCSELSMDPTSCREKAQFLIMTHKAWHVLHPAPLCLHLIPLPASAAWGSCSLHSTSGPLHWLFPPIPTCNNCTFHSCVLLISASLLECWSHMAVSCSLP